MNKSAGWEWLGIYLYRADGTYTRAEWVKSPEELVAHVPQIREHMKNRLEVRITNSDDELLFHAIDNSVEWDGIGLSVQVCQ